MASSVTDRPHSNRVGPDGWKASSAASSVGDVPELDCLPGPVDEAASQHASHSEPTNCLNSLCEEAEGVSLRQSADGPLQTRFCGTGTVRCWIPHGVVFPCCSHTSRVCDC